MIESKSEVIMSKGRLCSDDPQVASRYKLNDLYCNAWLALAITALARKKVPDALEMQPMHYSEIALKTGLHAQSLYRVLRAAAANGIFVDHHDGYFEHNECSKLLRSSDDNSWRGMSLMWGHPVSLRSWEAFAEAMVDGQSGIKHAFGKTLYECLGADEEAMLAFSDAMVSNSKHASFDIAHAFPFEKFTRLLDLGGGVGTLIATILKEHTNISGAVLELEELRPAAEHYFVEQDLSERLSFLIGDFLKEIPSGFDLYMVKNSLWNWDDEHCSLIMQNVRNAIGDARDSRFLIIEYIINEDNAPWTTLYDLQILNLPGGRARTQLEYERMLKQAGFTVDCISQAEDQILLSCRPE
ncbi:MAG: hypothetical protein K2Z81_06190 [Cyanobacteria bacterium]|nr:hypothetical protein [Cyanobacteriota bacterium]